MDSLELFDGVNQCAKWLAYLAYLGDSAYRLTLKMSQRFKSARARPGTPYWSWPSFLNFKVKRAVSYVNDFKVAVTREDRKRGVRGVVCGHIRDAEAREIDGVLHCIGGDGVERLPVLIEHAAGELAMPTHRRTAARPPRPGRRPSLRPGCTPRRRSWLRQCIAGVAWQRRLAATDARPRLIARPWRWRHRSGYCINRLHR